MMRSESDGSSSANEPALLPLPTREYEVFLSFRGPDVRQTFADCLYSCLVRSKIRTFRDKEELRKGETIGPSLVKAITESKIHIPILTESYASSKWCLQELAKMVDCWKAGGGAKGQHIILPVFYFIDPRDVRHQDSGPYLEAFEQHNLKHDPETVLEWKEALQEVGKMEGWHVTKSDGQGAVIDQIFTEVERHLRDNYTLMTDELVGIDLHVEEVMKLLNLDSASEKIVGIHGMGGVGKTTLAKAVYNKVSTQFEHCCFLENMRQTLTKNDGAIILQNTIISDILRQDSNEVKSVSEGIRVIKERVCRHKVLIVLDDVDGNFQFDDILGKLGNFSMDSRFLITTRDARVLELLQECKLYELEEMSRDHSIKLFSKHALGVDYPLEDYESLVEEFVNVAAGLPLAIKVIGSLVFRTDKRFWEAKLMELKKLPPAKVQERLKISYDELTHNEKQIFLDIACLFVGGNKEAPICMWSDCDFFPVSAIRTLAQRSLIKIDESKNFWMHDHVIDLGRAIVREESNRNPYKSSRIWSKKDAISMLKRREGTDCVEALIVDMRGEDLLLTKRELEPLSRLRYLEVWNGRLAGNFKDVLPNIRWLRFYRCDSFPAAFNLKKLVILDLHACSVSDEWSGWNEIKLAGKLKVANLLSCTNLKKVPDLSDCGGLEMLNLGGCAGMDGELDIRNFKNLRLLAVDGTRITKLNGEIERLQCLQKIDVSNKRLALEVPAAVSKLSSLEVLSAMFTACTHESHLRETLPDGLKTLAISSSSLPALPSSLKDLYIRYSHHLQRLPNLANLTNLTRLLLYEVGVREIPGLGELRLLATLSIREAPNLYSLDGLENLVLLQELSIQFCSILEKLPSLARLTRLHKLKMGWCRGPAEIRGLGELRESLLHLDLSDCRGLAGMEELHSMMKMETLSLTGMYPTDILPPSLSLFTKLRRLILLAPLKRFPDLSNLVKLIELTIGNCKELIEVTGLDTLESLEMLGIFRCPSIRRLPDLSRLVKLKTLEVKMCNQLTGLRGLGRLEALEELVLSKCESIDELSNLSGLRNLRTLRLKKCRQLKEVNGLEGRLEALELFFLSDCESIKKLPNLSGLKSLSRLRLVKCRQLKGVNGLEKLEGLQVFQTDIRRLKVRFALASISRRGKQSVTRSLRTVLGGCRTD